MGAFLLLALYHLVGVFPLAPVFGDGIAIANGATEIAASGAGSNALAYRYSQHSGTYILLAFLHNVTGLEAQTLFLAMSGLCAVIFVVGSALLIREITGCPLGLAGIVVMLFQESYSGGYYSNSTVVAAAVAIMALYVSKVSKSGYLAFLAGVLFGLSAWLRLDTVLIAPVILLLLYKGSWSRALRRTLIVGAVASGVCLISMYVSEARIEDIFQTAVYDAAGMYSEEQVSEFTRRSLVSYFSVLAVFLIVIGTFHLALGKRWYALAVFFLGIFPLPFYLFVFAEGLANPRFIYHSVPFFAIPAAHALWSIGFGSRGMKWAYFSMVAALFLVQYPIGVRGYTAGALHEQQTRSVLSRRGVPLGPGGRIASWRMGPGEQIIGHNGGRLSSGLLWAPLWHSRKKSTAKVHQEELYAYLGRESPKTMKLYSRDWTDSQLMLQIPLRLGYVFQSCELDRQTGWARYTYRKGDRIAIATRIEPDANDRQALAQILMPGAIFVTQRTKTFSGVTEWKQVAPWAYERLPQPAPRSQTQDFRNSFVSR